MLVGQQVAGDFTFFVETTIYDIHWTGRYDTNEPETTIPLGDQFTIEFWDDAGGLPGSLLDTYTEGELDGHVVRVPSQLAFVDQPGYQLYEYYVDLGAAGVDRPFVADANKTYWMSIINDSTGSPHYWFWTRSDGGDANGRSAQRDIGQPWGANEWDKAFDLTGGGEDKIIAVMSADCTSTVYTASGVGYFFDNEHCYINGYQEKQGDPEAHENHWRAVRAPWKFYEDYKVTPGIPATEAGVIQAYFEADVELPDDYLCLLENIPPTKEIYGVFEGLAAYDVTSDYYGVELGGVLYRECNGQIVQAAGDPSDVLNREEEALSLRERLYVTGLCFPYWDDGLDNGMATAIIDTAPAPHCFDYTNCPRCNVCYREDCIYDDGLEVNVCTQLFNYYGDIDANTTVGLFDVYRILDCFAGDFSKVSFEDCDIQPCAGDGAVGLGDLFAVLDAFAGVDPCCCCDPPMPTDPECEYGVPPACPPCGACCLPDDTCLNSMTQAECEGAPHNGTFMGGGSNCALVDCTTVPAPSIADRASISSRETVRETASIKLMPSQRTAHAGDIIDVDVYVTGVSNMRGYEAAVTVDGGRRGHLTLVDVSIDDRKDYALGSLENVKAIDARGRFAAAVFDRSGVATVGWAYLGTFSFEVSADAVGAFRIGLNSGAEATTLAYPNGDSINIGRVTPGMVLVTTPARGQ